MADSQRIKTVFLTGKGKMKLSKAFFADGTTESYPRAKNFTSHTREYDVTKAGMEKRVEDMKHFASIGGCMLKGELSKELEEEPRAGHSLKNKRNRTLLLDIDKFPVKMEDVKGLTAARELDAQNAPKPKKNLAFLDGNKGKIGKRELECLAEHILSFFPQPELKSASYTIHASSSMGILLDNRVSMHIEFILSNAVSPEIQTKWLQIMNYYTLEFSKYLELSSNGLTLKYPLDVSVSSNAKLIFIAHPFFENPDANPIGKDDRILRVEKQHLLLDAKILDVTQRPDVIKQKRTDFINALRKMSGLPKKVAKTSSISLGGTREEFLKNPDSMEFDIVDDSTDFVHLNVNNGDSNAYWFMKSDPSLVRNFKEEPVFRLEDANPVFYEEVLRKYAEFINAKKGGRQFIRRVQEKGGAFVCVEIDEKNTISEVMESKDKQAATDWGMQYGIVLPENVSYASMQYNPQIVEPYTVEVRENLPPKEIINTFVLPETLRVAEKKSSLEVDKELIHTTMKQICPATLRVISHVLADKEQDVIHFLNWLFVAATTRKKTGTTWLMQGVQGTGKGIMWEHIIQPLFGKTNTKKITIDELEDKFNANMRQTTMILVDEFRHSDAAGSKKLENRLKIMATEEEYSMRAMHTEYKQQDNFFNMIFFSNDRDAMRIQEGDRRINVGSRQENRLEMTLGGGDFMAGSKAISMVIEKIIAEREIFTNLVVSAMVCANTAKNARQNQAKQTMREASSTRMEDFARVISTGSLNGILYAMQDLPEALEDIRPAIRQVIMAVQHQKWSKNNPYLFITSRQMAALYSFYSDRVTSAAATSKYLNRHVSPNKAEPVKEGDNWGFRVNIPFSTENEKTFADIVAIYPLSNANNVQHI